METSKTNWIPQGYHTLTPYLAVEDIAEAIDFYREAFGAEEVSRLSGPEGVGVLHAELKIGDSFFMLGTCPEKTEARKPKDATLFMLHIYVRDVDKAFERAKAAGAKVKMQVEDMFWGDRYGVLIDPFGHEWSIGTHIEDLTPEQLRERAEEFFSKTAKH